MKSSLKIFCKSRVEINIIDTSVHEKHVVSVFVK